MKPPESGARNSRSSTFFESRHHGKDSIKTAGRMHRQRVLPGIAGEAEDLRGASRSRRREARPAADHRRIRGRLSLSEDMLPPDRLVASGQEGRAGDLLVV